jgi:hypothetical protein
MMNQLSNRPSSRAFQRAAELRHQSASIAIFGDDSLAPAQYTVARVRGLRPSYCLNPVSLKGGRYE